MKSKRNLIPIHYLSLHDLRETVTFDGINFHDWNHALKAFLKNDEKLYVLKVPIPEQPPLTSRTDHDVWWKHKCDAEDVSEIIMGTVNLSSLIFRRSLILMMHIRCIVK